MAFTLVANKCFTARKKNCRASVLNGRVSGLFALFNYCSFLLLLGGGLLFGDWALSWQCASRLLQVDTLKFYALGPLCNGRLFQFSPRHKRRNVRNVFIVNRFANVFCAKKRKKRCGGLFAKPAQITIIQRL